MGTKAQYRNKQLQFYEGRTYATVLPVSPVVFHDGFMGNAISSTTWTILDVAGGGVAYTSGVGGGICTIDLSSASEAQDSGVSMNDIRQFDLNANLVFEIRLKVSVLPTAGTKVVFGMAGNHNLDKDSITESAWFALDGGASLELETDDTSSGNDGKSSGITVTTGAFIVCKIDFSDLSNVRFFVNGAKVGTFTFDMSALSTAEAMMQPYIMLDKASGSSVGTLQVSDVTIWSDETA